MTTIKICVIGDFGVGKTSFVKRYCDGIFRPNEWYLNLDFRNKVIRIDDNLVTLQLWDYTPSGSFGDIYPSLISLFLSFSFKLHNL